MIPPLWKLMLLETQHRKSWMEHKRGQLTTVLKHIANDREGSFHGLGSIAAESNGGKRAVPAILFHDYGLPLSVIADAEAWLIKRKWRDW